jgi:sialate O-acetylesterase
MIHDARLKRGKVKANWKDYVTAPSAPWCGDDLQNVGIPIFGSACSVRDLKGPGCLVFLCLMAFSSAALHAEVRLSAVFADHMVIQRESPVHAWGRADSDEAVTISFRGETEKTTADEFGRWSLYLHPGTAGGPFEMVVQGTNRIVVSDVLVGDVWIASGQSNMEFPVAAGMNRGVNNEKEEMAAAHYPMIRILDIAPASSDYPLGDVAIRHAWSQCNPESVASFSAVGYFFARALQQREKVPIGVIDDTWGGRALCRCFTDAGVWPPRQADG